MNLRSSEKWPQIYPNYPTLAIIQLPKLKQVGIISAEEFFVIDAEQAFLRPQMLDPGACIQLLYELKVVA